MGKRNVNVKLFTAVMCCSVKTHFIFIVPNIALVSIAMFPYKNASELYVQNWIVA